MYNVSSPRGIVSDKAQRLSDVIERVQNGLGDDETPEYRSGYQQGIIDAFTKIHKLLDAAGVKVDAD